MPKGFDAFVIGDDETEHLETEGFECAMLRLAPGVGAFQLLLGTSLKTLPVRTLGLWEARANTHGEGRVS